jgi:hypothetical protein
VGYLARGQTPNHFWIEILKEVEKDMDLARPMREGAIKYSLSSVFLEARQACDGEVTKVVPTVHQQT